MTAQNIGATWAPSVAVVPVAKKLDRAAAGFGVAAGLTIIFNSLLVALTDTWPSIDAYASNWTGYAWNSHVIADLVVFFLIGVLLTKRRFTIGGHTLALFLLLSVVIATGGFVWWVARS
jgi:hypothetical protein